MLPFSSNMIPRMLCVPTSKIKTFFIKVSILFPFIGSDNPMYTMLSRRHLFNQSDISVKQYCTTLQKLVCKTGTFANRLNKHYLVTQQLSCIIINHHKRKVNTISFRFCERFFTYTAVFDITLTVSRQSTHTNAQNKR